MNRENKERRRYGGRKDMGDRRNKEEKTKPKGQRGQRE